MRSVQRRQAGRLFLPFGIEFRQAMLQFQQLPVNGLGAARLLVGLLPLEFGHDLGLAGFERLDLLLQMMHDLLLGFTLAGARLALLGFLTLLVLPRLAGSRVTSTGINPKLTCQRRPSLPDWITAVAACEPVTRRLEDPEFAR